MPIFSRTLSCSFAKYIVFLLGFSTLLVIPGIVQGQEQSSENTGNTGVVASTGITNVEIVSRDGREVVVGFDITNYFHEVEAQIKYSVQLVTQTEESDGGIRHDVKDGHVYDEELTLNPGQSVYREVTYMAPPSLAGEFAIAVQAQNVNGTPYSTVPGIETFVLEGQSGVFIDQVSCRLEVKGETYRLARGVDVREGEEITLACSGVENKSDQNTFTPHIVLKERTVFGRIVDEYDLSPITLATDTKEEFAVTLPLPEKPQAYTAEVYLHDDTGNTISNRVPAHFVVGGVSGTLLNVRIDKNTYARGEQAAVSLEISWRADAFPGSRAFGEEPPVDLFENDYTVDVEIRDQESGMLCGTLQEDGSVDLLEQPNMYTVDINTDCQTPIVRAILFDGDGNEIDREEVVFDAKDYTDPASTSPATDSNDIQELILVVAFVALVMIGAIIVRRKRDSFPKMLLFVIAFVIVGHFGVTADIAHADSETLRLHTPWSEAGVAPVYAYARFSSNKDVLSPGEELRVTIKNTIELCSNTNDLFKLRSRIGGKTFTSSCDAGRGCRDDVSYKTYGLDINDSPGRHSFRVRARHYIVNDDFSDNERGRIHYRVIDPQPSVSLSASPNPVDYDTASTLSWDVNNADQCTASGDWAGGKSTSGGSESTGALTSNKTYNIQCTNERGSDSDSVTVTVNEPKECQDGIDNDGDGLVDMNDPHCSSPTDNREEVTQCSDGIDNDGDGWVDYPADPGCDSYNDDNEFNESTGKQCSDGIDNDDDDLIDGNDPGCLNAFDDNETAAPDFSLTKTNDLEITIVGESSQASNSTTISSDVSESFGSNINLSAIDVSPNIPGISYDWSENSNLTPSEYNNNEGDDLKVTVPGGTSSGEYVITVQGQGGGLTRTIPVILNVQARDPRFENI